MEDGKIKLWLPTVRTGTGTDVFTMRLAKSLKHHGITTEITWLPLKYEPAAPLMRLLQPPAGTDIILANSWNGFAFKRPALPLIVTVHHGGFAPALNQYKTPMQRLYHRLLIRPFEKLSITKADAVTAVSQFAADSVKQHLHIASRIEVIHNWIDTARFCPAEPDMAVSGKPFRLLFAGKLSVLKGADLLVPIMRMLGAGFELQIAGNPGFGQPYELPDNVRVLGWLDEGSLIQAYQECDALLLPSRSEGFGYTAVEAMACGKPVIASRCSALPEIITDDYTGMLCPAGDVVSFANACRRLARNATLRRCLGEQARQAVLERFSEKTVVLQYAELIRRLVGSGKPN